ncbi:hypothetical protein [Halorientalis marina]|jgi:hypothetical protein|uniref:hypothetical protein n=1 Tax=Halorientalis marina TaxID=2931976 RepID=UPI001FF30D90|nr:hypothetical protein [Halorientalis marina]
MKGEDENEDDDESVRETRGPVTTIHWNRWQTILGTVLYAATLASMVFGAVMYLVA